MMGKSTHSLWQLLLLACSTSAANYQEYLQGKTFVFYYLWYGNPAVNEQWQHWDHEVLPHWTERVNLQFPSVGTRHSPPETIHSPYYPLRGPYSSTDPDILLQHMREIKAMGEAGGAGDGDIVVALSWWGQASREGTSDTQGVQTDDRVQAVLAAAEATNVSISWHLEPYPGRSAASVAGDVAYLEAKYGASPAVLRVGDQKADGDEKVRHAVYFVYDSYHVSSAEWKAQLLGPASSSSSSKSDDSSNNNNGDDSSNNNENTQGVAQNSPIVAKGLRGRAVSGYFVGLWLEAQHGSDLVEGGFDAFYTYFASSNFVYGSSPRAWRKMVQDARRMGLGSILSVGPGYADERIRPWNKGNGHGRRKGQYYHDMFRSAVDAQPDAVSITSYNEWGEGTQIEPARAQPGYLDYEGEGGPFAYLNATSKWIGIFRKQARSPEAHSAREL